MPKNTPEQIIDSPFTRAGRTPLYSTPAPPDGGGGGPMEVHTLSGSFHTGQLADSQFNRALLIDGSRTLLGNLGVADGVMIDGVDISLHAGNTTIHHSPATAGSGINIAPGTQVIAVDLADSNAGLEFDGANDLRVKPALGIQVTSTGVGVDLATDPGLDVDTGGLFVKASLGLLRDSSGLNIRRNPMSANSGLDLDGNGLSLASTLGGDGLLLDPATKILSVRTGRGLEIVSDLVRVDEDFAFNWAVVHTFNADPQINADLDFVGDNRVIRASDTLTLSPSTDLVLDPTGLILLPNPQELRTSTFNDFVAGIAGLRHFDTGGNKRQLTIGKLKADEMHVRVFSADEQRVSRGAEFWSRSFGIVESTFTLPGVGATRDVWFEEAPDLESFALFIPNEWVEFRTIDADTGLITQNVWFLVESMGPNTYIEREDASDGPPAHVSRQQFRLNRRSGGFTNMEIRKGSVGVGFGQPFSVTDPVPGQGVVHLSALAEDGGPFIQIQTFESVSAGIPNFKNRVRMGNLSGTVDYSATTWGFAAGNDLSVAPSAGFSGMAADATNGLRLFNTDIQLYEGGILSTSINEEHGIRFRQGSSGAAPQSIAWLNDINNWTTLRARIINYVSGFGSEMEIKTIATVGTEKSAVLLRAEDSSGLGQATLQLLHNVTQPGLSTIIPNADLMLSLCDTTLFAPGIPGGIPSTRSLVHLYENSSAVGATAGLTVEQIGTGDAVAQFVITSGGVEQQRYVLGIDNSDGDKFKISASANVGTNPLLTIDPATGNAGIGTATPSGKLVIVDSSGGAAAGFVFSGNTTGGYTTSFIMDSAQLTIGHNSATRGLALMTGGVAYLSITGTGFVGVGRTDPVSRFHIYSSTTNTGANAGQTIEQAGSGDAVQHFVIGSSVYSLGIDNSDGDKFKISASYTLGSSDFFVYDPVTGLVTVSGLSGSGGGGSGSYTAGEGITITGTEIAVNSSVARNTWAVTAGAGLTGGGNLAAGGITLNIGAGTGIIVNANDIALDFTSVASAAVVLTAGLGLTGGGNLTANRTFNVGEGDGIIVGTDTVAVDGTVVRTTRTVTAGLGMTGGGALSANITMNVIGGDGITANADDIAVDGTVVRTTRNLIAGNGLTGGGTLAADRTFTVGAGDGITVNADDIAVDSTVVRTSRVLTAGSGLSGGGDLSANRTFAVVPGDGIIITDDAVTLDPFAAGNGLGYSGGVLYILPGGGLEVGADYVRVDEAYGFVWTAEHAFLADIQLDANLDFVSGIHNITTAGTDTLNILPGGDLVLDPGGSQVLPGGSIEDDLGFYNRKWRTLFAAELYVETLVAQEVMATIGGRIIVAPTTSLAVDVAVDDTTITVKHNNLTRYSYIMLQAAPSGIARFEVMQTTSVHTTLPQSDGTNWYRYTVTRDLDGTGANAWLAGDAVVNLGRVKGEGYIDLTSTSTIRNHLGPTITIYARTGPETAGPGTTWGASLPVVTMGNLESFVGYGVAEFGFATGNDLTKDPATGFVGLTADRTNGVRLFNTPTELYQDGELAVSLDQTYGLSFSADVNPNGTKRAITFHTDLDPRSAHFARFGGYMLSATDREMALRMELSGAGETGRLWLGAGQGGALPVQDAYIVLYPEHPNTGIAGSFINTVADSVRIYTPKLVVGFGTGISGTEDQADSTLHVYENRNFTDASTGITIEQDGGSGDAALHFLLTDGQYWSMGIDNSIAGDPFRIAPSADLANWVLNLSTAGILHVTGSAMFGATLPPASRVHIYENTSSVGATTGLTIEQDGVGDAAQQFYLTGGQYWSLGIDNSIANDPFRIAPTADLANWVFNLSTAGLMHVTGGAMIGSTAAPLSRVHIYESSTATGASTGLTIEQAGSGDAALQFYLSASTSQYWSMGIDNSQSDNPFRISPTADLNDGVFFLTTAGALTVAGALRSDAGVIASVIQTVFDTGIQFKDDSGIVGLALMDGSNTVVVGSDSFVAPYATFVGQNNKTVVVRSATATSTAAPYAGFVFSMNQAGASQSAAQLSFMNEAITATEKRLAQIIAYTDGAVDRGALRLRTFNSGAFTDAVVINNTGRVGIGTTTPNVPETGSRFTVSGSDASLLYATIENSGTGQAGLVLRRDAGTQSRWVMLVPGGSDSLSFYNDTFANYVVTMLSSGNVGVNEPNPGAKLDVAGTAAGVTDVRSTHYGAAAFHFLGRRALGTKSTPTKATTGAYLMALGGLGYTDGGWATDASAQISFTATENYTNTANNTGAKIQFFVRNNATPTGMLEAFTINANRSLQAYFVYNQSVGATRQPMVIDSTGLFGSENWYDQTVSNDGARMLSVESSGKVGRANIYGIGVAAGYYGVLVDATGKLGAIAPPSSLRFKEAIYDVEQSLAERLISSLRPITYALKADVPKAGGVGEREYGFIAEEVAAIEGAAELVSHDQEGQVHGLSYERFIVPLIAVVQKLMQRVEELEARVNNHERDSGI